ncbi:MAG: type I methionyl aminopeptidase [Clostridiales bacterium]|nr:type I methionyl aminopeptidase [Clostridiales bacterium]
MIQKTPAEIVLIKKACEITRNALIYAKSLIKAGVSTFDIDKSLEKFIIDSGGSPACLGYNGYPAATCISVNDVVVHGIPSQNTILKEGDIVSVDIVVAYKGYHGDATRTFPVGVVSEEKEKLMKVTKECFFKGIENLRVGDRLGKLSYAIQQHAESNGFSVVRELSGHGIGRRMHEAPSVLNYGKVTDGPIISENAVLAIEPMINAGKKEIAMLSDGWGIVTRDRRPSAHYENTVLFTKTGAEILTLEQDDEYYSR